MKETVKAKLEMYGYSFSEKENIIIIKLDFSQFIIIDFTENGKVKINDKLKGWNFLTGVFNMSFKKAIMYQFAGYIIGLAFIIILNSNYNPTFLFPFLYILAGISISILFMLFYYFTKLENIKKQIICWIDNNLE